ncbi:MAG: SDR family oxidoreductase [Myxococcota bacterium]
MSAQDAVLVIGTDGALARELARALGGELEPTPAVDAPDDAWLAARARNAAAPPRARILVAIGAAPPAGARALVEQNDAEWEARAEAPLRAWTLALGLAQARCADGGAIACVVDAPAPLDAAGFAPEAGLADAVAALARSVALAEGARGVRANAIATPARIPGAPIAALAPPLARFPGTLAHEVAGAVRLLLSDDAAGITGRLLAADCGRAW